MHGYPLREDFPFGRSEPKEATTPEGARVRVRTACNEEGETTLVCRPTDCRFNGGPILGFLTFDGKSYIHHRTDPVTHDVIYWPFTPVVDNGVDNSNISDNGVYNGNISAGL